MRCVLAAGVATVWSGLGAGAMAAEAGRLDGAYLGLEAARQTVIAGALVDGVDVLAQDERLTASLVGGYRLALGERLVVGVEGAVGVGDQSLRLSDPSRGLQLRYRNGFEWRVGGQVGWRLGADRGTLVFAYVSETTRAFSVSGTTARGPLRQKDEQGLLRYGVGVERALAEGWRARATAGSSRADFGDRRRNMTPDRPIEVGVAVSFGF